MSDQPLSMSMFASSADYWKAHAARADAHVERLATEGCAKDAEIAALRAQLQDAAIQALSDSGQAIENLVDAERYRYLRAQHWATAQLAVVRNPKEAVKLGHELPSGERLDEAIDAARAADSAS